jgi:ATP-dependent DNA helicase RecG
MVRLNNDKSLRFAINGSAGQGGLLSFERDYAVHHIYNVLWHMSVAVSNPAATPLRRHVTALFGVGPERAAQLERLGIRSIEDLLLHRPNRYEDRQHLVAIAALELHQQAILHGKVLALGTKWFKQHTKSVFEIVLDDGTARLHCRWWNLPYMEKYFRVGDEVLAFGKVVSLKPRVIDHAETEVLEGGEEDFIHLNRIAPIYPLTEGLPQRWLRALIWRTLKAFESQISEPYPMPERAFPIPSSNIQNPNARLELLAAQSSPTPPTSAFPTRAQAIRMLHFPENLDQTHLARRRLALDEFVELQLQIQLRRRNLETKAQALPCEGTNRLIKPFLAQLGFKLTNSQTKVLRELRHDMSGPHPMRRLLQGDVGSGKTVVAACCALMSLESGYNVALMAPTEILAEQHFRNFAKWFGPTGIAVELRTGSRKTQMPETSGRAESKRTALNENNRPLTLTIGTHALIESGFNPEQLGLVIIDEQHKFGVAQREQLVRKGRYPHLLVMTATPIPRTLGLTLYGDLDVSILDQLPPGRGQIRTFVRTADKLPKAWDFVRSKLAEGRQAYVVYPRVEDGGQNQVKAVTKEFDGLQRSLSPFRVALLHGRLRPREKEDVMQRFYANKVQVLLATSLIEVGVDVPNATLMLIENAEQFGLAQLHQLRGRIGRGAHDAYCILVAMAKSKEAQQRLRVLEQSTDGFFIAEADLKLRGPGELIGQQQSGIPNFRFGDLAGDLDLIERARHVAAQLLNHKAAPPAK